MWLNSLRYDERKLSARQMASVTVRLSFFSTAIVVRLQPRLPGQAFFISSLKPRDPKSRL